MEHQFLLPHQAEFIYDTTSKYLGLSGGYGSAKSESAIRRTVALMEADSKINTAYLMPTHDLLVLRAVGGFKEVLDARDITYTYKKQEKTFELEGMGRIFLRSYDNPDSLIAFEIGHLTLDELDVLKPEKAEDIWNKAVSRIRQHTTHPAGNTISLVSTPDNGLFGFFYKRFVENPAPHTKLIKASTKSNFFLPPEYVQTLIDTYADNDLINAYLEGEFVSFAKTLQFGRYDAVKHLTDRVFEEWDTPLAGLDFNIMGCVAVIAVKEDNIIYFVDELVAFDTMAMVELLKERYPDAVLYPDASSQNRSANADASSLTLLKKAGFRVKHNSSNPVVASSLTQCNNHLAGNRIFVNKDTSPRLHVALQTLSYDERDKPQKFTAHKDGSPDDYADGFRYLINGTMPLLNRINITRRR